MSASKNGSPADESPNRHIDPLIEAYKKDVDRTLLRENLRLTPQQRFEKFEKFMEFVDELKRAKASKRLDQEA